MYNSLIQKFREGYELRIQQCWLVGMIPQVFEILAELLCF
jgi:hypothetical protein